MLDIPAHLIQVQSVQNWQINFAFVCLYFESSFGLEHLTRRLFSHLDIF